MKDQRSASQIQFGFLPDQTVDVRSGIWRIAYWNDTIREHAVDTRALRSELILAAGPWQAQGRDDGYVNALRAGAGVELRKLNRDRGITLRTFPNIWMCRRCKRVHRRKETGCPCGAPSGARSQLPFVAYHHCGRIREPYVPTCRVHRQVRIQYPGTASARDIVFDCPVCGTELRRGLGEMACECGDGNMMQTVHRAASVYTPRNIVMVNPPSTDRIERLTAAGGSARAMEWVIGGMVERNATELGATPESLRRQLQEAGLPAALIERTIADALREGSLHWEPTPVRLTEAQAHAAERDAVLMALAAADSRFTLSDLRRSVPATSEAGLRYHEVYAATMRAAGIETVELFDRFPVLVGQYGFTRGPSGPGESTLRPFRDRAGSFVVYGEVSETEAMLFVLSPFRVWEWLRKRNLVEGDAPKDERCCRIALLQVCEFPAWDATGNEAGERVLELVHSLAHRAIRLMAVHAGIERNALSELLVPTHLGFYLYASARGDFVLGGLQAVFESDLDTFLRALVHDEHRCALDPGCERGGAACTACLHVGEPSCRLYNSRLSRLALFGGDGYLG